MDLMVFSMLYLVNRIIFQKQHFFVTIMIITDILAPLLFCQFNVDFFFVGFE